MSVISLFHVRVSRVIKIVLTYLLIAVQYGGTDLHLERECAFPLVVIGLCNYHSQLLMISCVGLLPGVK